MALHPKTLSLYHRAQKSYAAKSAVGVLKGSDPDALRISTVEAVALLLEELGAPPPRTAHPTPSPSASPSTSPSLTPTPTPSPSASPSASPSTNPSLTPEGEPPRTTAAIVHALLQNNAALACAADPDRPKPSTAPDRAANPDRRRDRRRDHRGPSAGRARRAAEGREVPQGDEQLGLKVAPSKGQGGGGAVVGGASLASPCSSGQGQGHGAQAGGGGGGWVTIRHGPCGPVVQCRIPEHLLLA